MSHKRDPRALRKLAEQVADLADFGDLLAFERRDIVTSLNHSRLASMTYPNGFVVNDNYSSSLNDSISRLSSLSDTSKKSSDTSYSRRRGDRAGGPLAVCCRLRARAVCFNSCPM